MLLTVNRLGSTNISLRRFARGRRGRRRSAGGGYEFGIRRETLARRPDGRHEVNSVFLRRIYTGSLAQGTAEGEVSLADVDRSGESPSASRVDVEVRVAP